MKPTYSANTRTRVGPLRNVLRAGIAPLHAALDTSLAAVCLGPQPDPTLLLAIHAHALPPLVAGLSAAGAAVLWTGWDEPARLAALAADLHLLVPPPDILPREPAACFDGPDAAWGGLYALLGSRLGNRVILRRLAATGRPLNSAFLHFGMEDTGAWPRFLYRLEHACVDPAAAACGATIVMRRYLDAVMPHVRSPAVAPALSA